MAGKVKQLPNRLPLLTLVFVIVGIQSSNAQLVHFSEEAFDKATFSQLPLLQARQVCLESLNEQLVRIAEVTSLTEHQREKLRTAGEVDIHRYFGDYKTFKSGIPFGNIARDQWQQLSVESRARAKPFSRQFLAGLHRDDSIFMRLLKRIATHEQLIAVSEAEKKAESIEYAEQIDAAMLVVGRSVPLTDEQRKAIKELLMTKTTPPSLFGNSLMPLYFVLARMGQVEEELRDLFDANDWPAVKKLVEAGKTATE